ncbi:sigma-70 family RNA polymerase sigma factor [Ferruginibacter paludis]|uniref:RNA polymerase sigma factor n=1 Tax=Ferruginibacter paludis TaxID=1310417 RepID=UPI0025B4E74C|nr:sigma-70 family RNA polymerase sigma factor [Ferruginibacter paludis]MDN3656678.1 sigma-70 family RNA polymerase sigma factor [Ferruginibacter paludis]
MQTNTEIIIDLKGENNQAFGTLYKNYFGVVNRFITNNSGTNHDAEDIFQDAMIVLVAKLRQDDFVLEASVKTYIMAIAKNLWFKKLRTANRETEFTAIHNEKFYAEISLAIEQEKTYMDKLQYYIHQISDHCRRLIHDMFFKNQPIKQIQQDYGYTSIHNAQNQKHKCVEQIRKIKEKESKKKCKNILIVG